MNGAGEGSPEARPKRWFRRHPVLFFSSFIPCVALLMDFAAGTISHTTKAARQHAYYHHGLKENFRGRITWGHQPYQIVTNSAGLKDDNENQVSRTSSSRRVLLLGDSFVEGLGFPYQDTVAGQFARALEGTDLEIFNGGTRSHSPKLYYLKLRYLTEVRGIRFDEVYVFVDYSDVQDEIVYEPFHPIDNPLYQRLLDADRYVEDHFLLLPYAARPLIDALARISLRFGSFEVPGYASPMTESGPAVRLSFHADQSINPLDPGGVRNESYDFWGRYAEDRAEWSFSADIFEKWGGRGLALARLNLELLVDLCRRQNMEVTLVVYPWPRHVRERDLGSIQVRFWKQFTSEMGIRFLDLFPLFINDRPGDQMVAQYFIDGDFHWNPQGHALVAGALTDDWRRKQGEK